MIIAYYMFNATINNGVDNNDLENLQTLMTEAYRGDPHNVTNNYYSAEPSPHSYPRNAAFNGGGTVNQYAAGQVNSIVTPIGDEEEISGDISKQDVADIINKAIAEEENQSIIYALINVKDKIINHR